MKYVLIALTALMFTGCKKDDDKTPETTKNPTVQSQITSDIEKGTWQITNFNEDGKNETQNYVGYAFTFKADGTISAANGENTQAGSWSITDDNSDDDQKDDLHFNITFNLSNNFDDLSDDWHILSYSETKIELQDVSGGNGGTDLLTFEKK